MLLCSCLRRLDRFIQSTARTLGLCVALGAPNRFCWHTSFASDSSSSSISLSGCLGLFEVAATAGALRQPLRRARHGFCGFRDSRGRSYPFPLKHHCQFMCHNGRLTD